MSQNASKLNDNINLGFEDDEKKNNEDAKNLQINVPIEKSLSSEKESESLESKNLIISLLIEYKSKFVLLLKKSSLFSQFLQILLFIAFKVYFIYAIYYHAANETNFNCCKGIGFLIIITAIVYTSLFYYYFAKKRILKQRNYFFLLRDFFNDTPYGKISKYLVCGVLIAALVTFMVLDVGKQPRRFISAFGTFVLLFFAFLISKHPSRIKWKQVFWGIGLQFLFGLMVLKWDLGRSIFECISDKVKTFVEYTYAGSDFMYGYLSSGHPQEGLVFPPILVFRSLSVLFFIGFVIQTLYHWGVLQWIVIKLGWLLQVSIGTTAIESLSVSANIFLSLADVPLLIQPFINDLTKSEIHAVLTGGLSTIAGAIMAAYIDFGISATYLLSASVMAAPACLAVSKLVYPETEISKTKASDVKTLDTKSEETLLSAASQGAIQAIALIASCVAIVIAVIATTAFFNGLIGWLGMLVGLDFLSLEYLLGKVFIPVAWLMGVDPEELESVGTLLGIKIVLNEFVGYTRLVKMNLSPRGKAIATYGLCSFSNLAAVGIQLGIMVALEPRRKEDLSKTIGYALISGIIVTFSNACMAGFLLGESGYAEWTSKNMTILF